MVRKQTWILLGVFALMLALVFLLRDKPLAGAATGTPTATEQANLLPGWQFSDIVWIEYTTPQAGTLVLTRTENGEWAIGSGDQPVQAGVVEQVRAQIAAFRLMANLDPNYDLQSLGLQSPEKILVIRDIQGRQAEIHFGNLTPTGNGYYVQLDGQAPVVISKYGADDIFEKLKMDQLFPVTPQPPAMQTPEASPVP